MKEIKIVMGGYLDENDRLMDRARLNEWISEAKRYINDLELEIRFLRNAINVEEEE